MEVVDIVILVMAAVSAGLLIYNMRVAGDVRLPVRLDPGRGELRAVIDGRAHRGIVYRGEGLPRGEGNVSQRLVTLAASSRVNVSFISNMVKAGRSRLLKYIEEEIRKTELAYAATKHVKYHERLNFLNNLYRSVARLHTPYTGGLSLIIWIPEGEEEAEKSAEAFKSLVEAELGITLKRVQPRIEEALTVSGGSMSILLGGEEAPLPLQQPWDKSGVTIGTLDDEAQTPVVLSWPSDFEAHMAVFGPTGRGKTVLLAGIASQLGVRSENSLDPYMVAVVDPKGDLAEMLAGMASRVVKPAPGACIPLPRLDGAAQELVESSIEAGGGRSSIRPCIGSILERGLVVYDLSGLPNEDRNTAASLIMASLALEASESRLPGRVALIVDEAWRAAQGRGLHMVMALREGRSRGLHVIYATQSPGDVPQPVSDNTRTLAVFGGYTRGYTETVRRLGLEDARSLLALPVGMAMLRVGDLPPVRVRILDFKKLLKTPRTGLLLGRERIRDGQKAQTAEGRKGEPNIPEPETHTPRPSQVPPTHRGDAQG